MRRHSNTSPSGRLVRRYFLVSLLLVSGGLLTSGLVQIYYSYTEALKQLALLQKEKADSAAFRIEQFFASIEQGLKTTAKSRELVVKGISGEYRFELGRLLSVLPPIMDLVVIPIDAGEAVQVSRFTPVFPNQPLSPQFRNTILAFQSDKKLNFQVGAVEFARSSEPHITLAVPVERYPGRLLGALFADVDLRYVTDVISTITIGKKGYAYIVNNKGELIAHPNMSLVLGRANLGAYNQVKQAFAQKPLTRAMESMESTNFRGEKVLGSYARIRGLNWAVIIEQPAGEVYETIYANLLRTSTLALLGLVISLLASIFVSRRVVRPLEILGAGARRIGQGDLNHQLQIKTGDEIEALADEFNKMSDALKQSYAGLEAKVNERTQKLQVANERLKELDRLKSHFLSSVSHELRTPLTAIRVLIDNMLDGFTGSLNPKQTHYVSGIKESTERLRRLIHDLLDISMIESGRMDLKMAQFSVASLIREVADVLMPVAQEKSISLVFSSMNGEHVASADRDKITQVLTNLISNAVKFTPSGGKVALELESTGDGSWIQVAVSDTGPGIAPEEARLIFDEFYQINRPNQEKVQGVGLGLAICKKLIDMHGGKIYVESPVGQGSTFFFTVPAHRETHELRQTGAAYAG